MAKVLLDDIRAMNETLSARAPVYRVVSKNSLAEEFELVGPESLVAFSGVHYRLNFGLRYYSLRWASHCSIECFIGAIKEIVAIARQRSKKIRFEPVETCSSLWHEG